MCHFGQRMTKKKDGLIRWGSTELPCFEKHCHISRKEAPSTETLFQDSLQLDLQFSAIFVRPPPQFCGQMKASLSKCKIGPLHSFFKPPAQEKPLKSQASITREEKQLLFSGRHKSLKIKPGYFPSPESEILRPPKVSRTFT